MEAPATPILTTDEQTAPSPVTFQALDPPLLTHLFTTPSNLFETKLESAAETSLEASNQNFSKTIIIPEGCESIEKQIEALRGIPGTGKMRLEADRILAEIGITSSNKPAYSLVLYCINYPKGYTIENLQEQIEKNTRSLLDKITTLESFYKLIALRRIKTILIACNIFQKLYPTPIVGQFIENFSYMKSKNCKREFVKTILTHAVYRSSSYEYDCEGNKTIRETSHQQPLEALATPISTTDEQTAPSPVTFQAQLSTTISELPIELEIGTTSSSSSTPTLFNSLDFLAETSVEACTPNLTLRKQEETKTTLTTNQPSRGGNLYCFQWQACEQAAPFSLRLL